mgnify:FL=1
MLTVIMLKPWYRINKKQFNIVTVSKSFDFVMSSINTIHRGGVAQ